MLQHIVKGPKSCWLAVSGGVLGAVCCPEGNFPSIFKDSWQHKKMHNFFYFRSLNLEQEARERESEKERNKLLGIATPASSSDNSKQHNWCNVSYSSDALVSELYELSFDLFSFYWIIGLDDNQCIIFTGKSTVWCGIPTWNFTKEKNVWNTFQFVNRNQYCLYHLSQNLFINI